MHLRGPALTLVIARIRTQVDTCFHRLGNQHKSTQVERKSTVCAWNITAFATCVDLVADLRVRLARALYTDNTSGPILRLLTYKQVSGDCSFTINSIWCYW